MDENNATATEIKIEDTGDKVLETIPEVKTPTVEQKTEKKEEKITKCPDDVPEAIFSCLAAMTDCERLKLTKEEAARMSEAITQLFGKHLGGRMWWFLILVVTVLGKIASAWQDLTKKKDKKEQKKEQVKGTTEAIKEQHVEDKDLVEVTEAGRIIQMPKQEAIRKGLIKAAEA